MTAQAPVIDLKNIELERKEKWSTCEIGSLEQVVLNNYTVPYYKVM